MPWEWLSKNIGSILVLFAVAAMLSLMVIYLVKSKKKGGSSRGGCAGCPHASSCPSKMLKKQESDDKNEQ